MPITNHMTELMGTFPRLPFLHSLQLINRAWSRVRDIRAWSWEFVVDSQWFTPAVINSGTVTTVQYSTIVTVDATAAAAINAAGLVPPIASSVLGIGRQLRVGISTGITPMNGNIYNIVNWDGVSQLTIDKPFGESSITLSPYQIYKCYYAAPSLPATNLPAANPGMIRIACLTNRANGSSVSGRRLNYTQQQLNSFDPQRGATDGYIRGLAPYQTNSLGQPTWEAYPAPVSASAYAVTYWSRWPDVSLTQDFPQPPYCLSSCVLNLARVFAAQWALANVGTFPELGATNWVALQQMYKQDHLDDLKQCLKQDDEIMPMVPFFQGRKFSDFPLDGNFLQAHDMSGLLG
jgi:hypothetical protein